MRLVVGQINKTYIEFDVVRQNIDDCTEVIAIVAYCDSTRLFDICKEAGRRVSFYGRLDHTAPVTSSVLAWFLSARNPNFCCSLFRGGLHAKVIWLKGVGVYIGSANLTENGWVGNVEAGTFTNEDDFTQAFEDDLHSLVDIVHEKSASLTDEIFELVSKIEKRRGAARDADRKDAEWFDKSCPVPKVPPLNSVIKAATGRSQRKDRFLKEWHSTLQLLRSIGYRLRDYRPSWVESQVPDGVHVDQFLHAYYYLQVREGNSQPFDVYYERHRSDPDAALSDQMRWWKVGEYLHENESTFMHDWAPSTKALLAKDKILLLSEEEFTRVVHQVHAMREHATRLDNDVVKLPAAVSYSREEKMDAFARWLFAEKSIGKKTVLETIYFVLYGGSIASLPERIWEATSHSDWKIAHLGLSSLGEMVGWALPEQFPPRNSRTSKALRALGNNVNVY